MVPEALLGLQFSVVTQHERNLLSTKQLSPDAAQLEVLGDGDGGDGEGALIHPSTLTSTHGQDPARFGTRNQT